MEKKFKIIISIVLLLVILTVLVLVSIKDNYTTGPMLPRIDNETMSEMYLNEARNDVAESEQLLVEAKEAVSDYKFFDRFFIKRTIRKMERKINEAKEDLARLEEAHLNQDYFAVASAWYSVSGKTSYANHYLNGVLEGKTKKDWNKVDSYSPDTIEGVFVKDLGHPFSGSAIMTDDGYYRISGDLVEEILALEDGTKIGIVGTISESKRTIPEAGDFVTITEKVIDVESYEVIE
ncbi:MAG: hypothetical protein ABIB43_04730 [archaeon]